MSFLTAPNRLETQRWHKKRIGIFGGSFNPPHAGHLHVAKTALAALQLDFIWWMVTPQNPIKEQKPTPLVERIQACEALIDSPQMIVTGLEADLGARTSYQTVKKLKHNFPSTEFIWITGLDNAHTLHRWDRWQDLLAEIPFLHITRPPAQSIVRSCPLRFNARQTHIHLSKSARHPLKPNHTYWMMNKKLINMSSTEIRENIT